MLLSSAVDVQHDKIQIINQLKRDVQPIMILDSSKLKPDPSVEKLSSINPALATKNFTIEDIKLDKART